MILSAALFFIYTDHKTLLNFATQKDLSHCQACWMETLSIYNCKFIYVKGEDNTMVDALSWYPSLSTPSDINAQDNAHHPHLTPLNNPITILDCSNIVTTPLISITALTNVNPQHTKIQFSINDDTVSKLWSGYEKDPWCKKLLSASHGMPNLSIKDGLWFLGDRLIIPANCGIRKQIFRLAHDNLGHFGFRKTYDAIHDSYFWPNMCKNLEEGYIPSCVAVPTTKVLLLNLQDLFTHFQFLTSAASQFLWISSALSH